MVIALLAEALFSAFGILYNVFEIAENEAYKDTSCTFNECIFHNCWIDYRGAFHGLKMLNMKHISWLIIFLLISTWMLSSCVGVIVSLKWPVYTILLRLCLKKTKNKYKEIY